MSDKTCLRLGLPLAMTGHNLEIISQIVLWYENSFLVDGCYIYRILVIF